MNEPVKVDNEAVYRAAMTAIGMAAMMIRQYDLPSMIQSIERADAFGCFTDPTLYMQAAPQMREQRKLVEAALPLWRAAQEAASHE